MASSAKKRRSGSSRTTANRSGNPAARNRPSQPSPGPRVKTAAPVPVAGSRPARPAPGLPDELEVLPRDGVEYPQILRNQGYQWWRSLGGAAFGLAMFLLFSMVVNQAVVALIWAVAGREVGYSAYLRSAFAFERPSGMLGANLGIVTLIPIAWGLMAVIHRVKPRWLSSVQPGIRWRYLLICLAVAAVALNGVLFLSAVVTGIPGFRIQPGFWGFFVVILLTSPLQAAAEEIFFRGYLMQALGSLFANPWFGVIVSSVVFALFHGTQNLPLFLDRLVFGLLAALLVWRTGGLEAGIAAHVVNNICAYLFAGLTTSIATVRAVREIGWADAAFDVGGFAVFAALAFMVAKVMKLRTRVDLSGGGVVEATGRGPV